METVEFIETTEGSYAVNSQITFGKFQSFKVSKFQNSQVRKLSNIPRII